VVTLGLNSIDLVAVVAEYPASNTKQRLQGFARLPGGQMATASAVCARLDGAPVTSGSAATTISDACRGTA
jgi:sugar/nucleoside kinase (ribokinase family)